MTPVALFANFAGWPAFHLAVARIAVCVPDDRFADDTPITRARSWEQDGKFYRNWFAIRKWKSLLPDGAPCLGGFSKKYLASRHRNYLAKYLMETRRAELAHWAMLCCTPVFFLWNPVWADCVMVLYGIVANIPCILVQRYNRLVLLKCTMKRKFISPPDYVLLSHPGSDSENGGFRLS